MNPIETALLPLLKQYQVVDWGYTEDLVASTYEPFEKWVSEGKHGSLHYLSDHRKEARRDLKSVLPDAQSAVSFLFSYHPEKLALENFYEGKESNGLKVASYTAGFEGKDYHLVVREYLNELAKELQRVVGEFSFRHSLDIQPVLERDLAYRCGLGWFGKNSMLINREHGSFFIIGSLILNKKLELSTRDLEVDHCGQCRACIEACPTDAIDGDKRTLKADACISTWTIELFKEGPEAPKGMEDSGQYIFGCDICQDVCPWNKRPIRLGLEAVEKVSYLEGISKLKEAFLTKPIDELINDLSERSNSGFSKEFKDTPLGRTGRRGLLKNLQFWKKP